MNFPQFLRKIFEISTVINALYLFNAILCVTCKVEIKCSIVYSSKHLDHYADIGPISFQNTICGRVGDNGFVLNFDDQNCENVVDFRVNRENFAEPKARAL